MTNPLYDHLIAPHIDQRSAFLYLADGDVLSYRDFLQLPAQFAHYFCKKGLTPGERVAAQVSKSPESLALYVACIQAGLVFLPLNPAYTTEELQYFITDSGAGLLITDQKAVIQNCHCETLADIIQASKEYSTSFETIPRSEDDLAALLYTSGTTGRPKGAMLSQKNLLSNAQALIEYWKFSDKDTLLHALPLFHTHGLFVACNVTFLAGGSMIFLPKFDLEAVLTDLPEATCMMGVPTFYTRLLADHRFSRELCQHIRLFISGSAPLLAQTHQEFEQRTGHRILERYGMTETSMNTSNPYDGERRAGTVGFPLPGVEIRIADPESHAPLSNGEIGSVEVRGDNVFQGYWQMPEKTAEEFREDGFFITGDLGFIDDHGYLNIAGRNKDLIISGGYNLYPKEIETVLDDQPGVQESAVIGVPHPDLGEAAIALLVTQSEDLINLEAISAALHTSLARYKHPRSIILTDALPRNSMSKVQKNLLREQYRDVFDVQ